MQIFFSERLLLSKTKRQIIGDTGIVEVAVLYEKFDEIADLSRTQTLEFFPDFQEDGKQMALCRSESRVVFRPNRKTSVNIPVC